MSSSHSVTSPESGAEETDEPNVLTLAWPASLTKSNKRRSASEEVVLVGAVKLSSVKPVIIGVISKQLSSRHLGVDLNEFSASLSERSVSFATVDRMILCVNGCGILAASQHLARCLHVIV